MPLPDFLIQINDQNFEMYVDNHMLATYSVCPRLFYYKHILNRRPKGGISFYPAYGIWWHKVMEHFYANLGEGFCVEQLFAIAAKQWSADFMNSFATSDPKRFEKMTGSYGNMTVGGEYETPISALTMVKQYYDQFYEKDRRDWRIISVEGGFGHEKEVKLGSFYLFHDIYVTVYYTGRPDLVVMDSQDRIFPVDHKSTDKIKSNLENLYKPHSETAGYIYTIQTILEKPCDRCIINVAAREVPAKDRETGEIKPRYKRIHPFYSPEELKEWRHNAFLKCEEIAKLALLMPTMPEEWGMRETQCFQFGRNCDFHEVDRVKPESREMVLDSNFVLSDPWRPYEKRKEEQAGE